MQLKKTYVTFKTKIQSMADGRKYIAYKRKITKHDTPLKPHEHYFYNSDMMDSIVQKAYNNCISGRTLGHGDPVKGWSYIDNLPQGVSILNPDAFVVTVKVEIYI